MSDQEKKIFETFGKVIPGLSEIEKCMLLAFGEGMAFKVAQQDMSTQEIEPAQRIG